VETLRLDPLVVQHHTAIGEHAVHVGKHELDLLALPFEIHGTSS
jgi:hypothetical protein